MLSRSVLICTYWSSPSEMAGGGAGRGGSCLRGMDGAGVGWHPGAPRSNSFARGPGPCSYLYYQSTRGT